MKLRQFQCIAISLTQSTICGIPLILSLLTISVSSQADIVRGKAWAWANQASSNTYTPSGPYQYTSTGTTITIDRFSTGMYRVNIPGMGTDGGSAHVSAYGGSHYCKPTIWYPNGTTLWIYVRCWDNNNNLVDGRYTVLFYKENRGPGVWEDGYVFANDASSAAYIPDLNRQWNSKGGTNSVQRLAIGHYQIIMPGLDKTGGTVLATAYGWGSERCKVVNWQQFFTTNTVIRVNCFSYDGLPVDTRFTVSYMSDLAIGVQVPLDEQRGGFVWANLPVSASYTPSLTYQHNNVVSIPNTASRTTTGNYVIDFKSIVPSNKTTTQVTAYGSGSEYCNIAFWFTDFSGGTNARYRCYTNSGTPVDTRFTATYLTNHPILR